LESYIKDKKEYSSYHIFLRNHHDMIIASLLPDDTSVSLDGKWSRWFIKEAAK
ncbi:12448_t:CDS:1, partial [Dentiscutata erythropus]